MAEELEEQNFGWRKGEYIGITPPKRVGQSFCTAGQAVIMFGGSNETNFYNDVWMLDISLDFTIFLRVLFFIYLYYKFKFF